MLMYIVVAAAIILVDQLVKQWAAGPVRAAGTIPLLDEVFHLTYTENRGAAFSILQEKRWFLIAATAAMVVFLLWVLKKGYVRNRWGRTGVVFVIAGALGNLVDRVRLGYVVDLFDFRLINFAVFNVADVFIVTGGIMCVIYFLFMDDKLQKEKGNAQTDA